MSPESLVKGMGAASHPKSHCIAQRIPMAGKPELVSSSQSKESSATTGQTVGTPALPSKWQYDRQLTFLVLVLLTVGALYVSYLIFRPFLAAIFLAFVLAIAFSPLHDRILKRVRGPNTAALLSTVIVVLFILVPCIFISVKLMAEAAGLYRSFSQQWMANGGLDWISGQLHHLAGQVGIPYEQLRAEVIPRIQQFGNWLIGMVGWAVRGVVQQSITASLVFFILFFLLRDKEKYRQSLFDVLPLPAGRVEELATTVHQSIIGNIYGMFVVGVIQGILTGLGFWVTGLRAPMFWGIAAMLFSFIPMVGPILVWAPAAVVLLAQGEWGKGVLMLVWGMVLISGADYAIRPRLAGRRVTANTVLILLSLLGGVKAFGVIGIFVGPVVLSLIIALLRIVREEHAGGSAVIQSATLPPAASG